MTDRQQTDWVGYSEFPQSAEMDVCPVCNSLILNLGIGGGRFREYCSDSCKMKAYRQRKKSVTNAAAPILSFSSSIGHRGLRIYGTYYTAVAELDGVKYSISNYSNGKGGFVYCVTYRLPTDTRPPQYVSAPPVYAFDSFEEAVNCCNQLALRNCAGELS